MLARRAAGTRRHLNRSPRHRTPRRLDQLSTKYTGALYPRGQERVVVVIEPERQTVGVG